MTSQQPMTRSGESPVTTQQSLGSTVQLGRSTMPYVRTAMHIAVVWTTARRRALIAAAGYIIVVVFIVAYLVANHASGWFGLSQTSQPLAITFAVLVAAPLVLAFVWDRLSKLTIGNFGVELTAVTTQPGNLLPSELQGTNPVTLSESYLGAILPRIQAAIQQEEAVELLKVDLGDGNLWWSTRLYLLAALAEDYTRIRGIVFVERCDGHENCFVGLATPSAVRQSLAKKTPALEASYRAAYSQAFSPAPATVAPENEVPIVLSGYSSFVQHVLPGGEADVKTEVTSERLRQWLGTALAVSVVPWDGRPATPLLLFSIMERSAPYVALIQDGQVMRIVNSEKMAVSVADAAVRQRLGG